ncbi:hypothetical protein GCWU000325_00039 [Alloprevotella tannerae ATCC 51259]|uniref:Uncharacterized protein n=1 Tax=Alloprevotella tannerae ATCC 51259 TaxID=626522 RepID=C9LCW9_9BACT|nr:hypothetical protein GCWU000325_00039 [Alloprevotella tannerae ATCC 51259]
MNISTLKVWQTCCTYLSMVWPEQTIVWCRQTIVWPEQTIVCCRQTIATNKMRN